MIHSGEGELDGRAIDDVLHRDTLGVGLVMDERVDDEPIWPDVIEAARHCVQEASDRNEESLLRHLSLATREMVDYEATELDRNIVASEGSSELSVFDWLALHATDHQVVTVFTEYALAMERIARSGEVNEALEEELNRYSRALDKLEDVDLPVSEAKRRVGAYMNDESNTKIVLADSFHMVSDTGGHAAYVQRGNNDHKTMIVFKLGVGEGLFATNNQSVDATVDRIKYTAFHEFNHAFLGSLGRPWLEEALTEHISQFMNGERDIYDLTVGGSDLVYPEFRNNLASIIRLVEVVSGGDISAHDFFNAYMQDDETAKEFFIEAAGECLGFDILEGIHVERERYIQEERHQLGYANHQPSPEHLQQIEIEADRKIAKRIADVSGAVARGDDELEAAWNENRDMQSELLTGVIQSISGYFM